MGAVESQGRKNPATVVAGAGFNGERPGLGN
jgi:hypothetical protein